MNQRLPLAIADTNIGIAHFAESKPVNAMTLFKFSRP